MPLQPISTCPVLEVICNHSLKDSMWSDSQEASYFSTQCRTETVTLGPHISPAPADLSQVVCKLTNDPRNCQLSTWEGFSLTKNANQCRKTALLISKGKMKLPSQIIYKPIFLLKSSCAINYYAINLVESK